MHINDIKQLSLLFVDLALNDELPLTNSLVCPAGILIVSIVMIG